MCDQGSEIDGDRFLLYLSEEFPYVDGRPAAIAGDQRRHSHPNKILSRWKVVDIFNMGMNIDETRSDDLIMSIDCLGGRFVLNTTDLNDTACLNSDRAAKPRVAGAVNNAGVDYDQIVLRVGLRHCQTGQYCYKRQDQKKRFCFHSASY